MKIEKMVDDLISAAMAYNNSLSCEVSFSVFDSDAERLCSLRRRLIALLRGKNEKK